MMRAMENRATNSGISAAESGGLQDSFQRRISYLRLSVTDRCDLRCTYCMPEAQTFLPRSEVLTLEELYQLALAFIDRGITRIRLTGGEPLVRRDVIDLVRAIGRRIGQGLDELTLTTNGTQLASFAGPLFDAGVRRINVSLDSRDPAVFAAITRRDRLKQVLDGIAAAREAGLKVKLNTVAYKGVNEGELPDLVAWAHGQGHDITLIEVMPLGEIEQARLGQFLPLTQVRQTLEQRWTLRQSSHRTGGPARYYDVAETGGRIGLISPLTRNFCDSCNRIRVTATGQLYPCLGHEDRVDLRAALRSGDSAARLDEAIASAMRIKPLRHEFAIGEGSAPAVSRHMSMTGG